MTGESAPLLDYCGSCLELDGRARMDTLTVPESLRWDGQRTVVASYRCAHGHAWTATWNAARVFSEAA